MKNIFPILLFLFAFASTRAEQQKPNNINWSVAATLPSTPGQQVQRGLAGPLGGVHNNVLLLAGGANFPEGLPWEGGKKKYWQDVFVLLKNEKGDYYWHDKTYQLPQPLAYAANATTDQGIISIGGENDEGIQKAVQLLQWNPAAKEVEIKVLPPLPLPLTNAAAAAIGSQVYVAGGETTGSVSSAFYRLDLSTPDKGWEKLPDLPTALSHAVAVVQSNGEYPSLFLIGGRAKTASGVSELFGTTFRYDPRKNYWKKLSNISDGKGKETTLSAATGVVTGANYILIFGGDKGNIFSQIEQYNAAIASTTDGAEKQKLEAAKLRLQTEHKGFSKDIYLYNTVTDAWTKTGTLPYGPVTTFATRWGHDILIPSGEIRPGVRTAEILKGSLTPQHYFAWLDYIVVVLYLLLMVGIGMWTSRHQDTTDDYFRGGQRIPGWAAGLSIYGTQLSAITFMSIPAKTYATNWSYFILQVTIILVIPIITNYFIPFYRRLQITSAYEYLEKRFNYMARAMASLLYIMLQLGRLAIVLLLPSLALTLVTGINVNLCIVLMGAITIFYTMKGGIEAVIWTDVAQVVILLGGALVCLVMIPFQLEADASAIWQTIRQNEKLNIIDTTFSFAEPTLWVVLLGGLAINMISYGADQSVVQRYITTKDEATSKKSMRLGAWMALPSAIIFFSIGTMLYLFFKEHPERVNYQLQSQDSIFPWYIVTELPAGITGLLIAAVFAAAMSTLSSSMNSVTTAIITDFYRRFAPTRSDKSYLSSAKYLTLAIGVVGTSLALVMAQWGISSLWDQFNMILGLFTGGLGGLFVLGIFTTRANAKGAVSGLLASGVVQFYISQYTNINLLLYAFTGLLACVVFGYLFSLLFGGQEREHEGLTVYDKKASQSKNTSKDRAEIKVS
ncbi:cyclically-permuted mutarotase family protein [Pontibacter ummariensis]|uniref:Cyclically-permuted mutarotase family protein n=1 Tax=Pontibacter ummariensis TaxID=1610492 RepID=A0A239L5U1_9BACT|nr:sodium/solute symporter [Pontibacter ummariensis]PRY04308.1 cyclically-permuted mutarotase family protein [Pontibacter ummariensis]SNT25049.1 cyclically-permuted mutarotase family protein [Pontibacter ummariensis]